MIVRHDIVPGVGQVGPRQRGTAGAMIGRTNSSSCLCWVAALIVAGRTHGVERIFGCLNADAGSRRPKAR
jgi:hypothetical protein